MPVRRARPAVLHDGDAVLERHLRDGCLSRLRNVARVVVLHHGHAVHGSARVRNEWPVRPVWQPRSALLRRFHELADWRPRWLEVRVEGMPDDMLVLE